MERLVQVIVGLVVLAVIVGLVVGFFETCCAEGYAVLYPMLVIAAIFGFCGLLSSDWFKLVLKFGFKRKL